MLHYYLNLYDGNLNRALAVKSIAQNQFEQFERYIRNSIAALERKEVKASWEKVQQKNLAELSVIGGIYEFAKRTAIKISGKEKGYYRLELLEGNPNYAKKIEYQIGSLEGEVSITEEDYNRRLIYIKGIEAESFDNLRWGFAKIDLKAAWFNLKKGDVLQGQDRTEYQVTSEPQNDEITIAGWLPANEKLFYENSEISFNVTNPYPLPKNTVALREYGNTAIFYSQIKLNDNDFKLKNHKASEYIDFSGLSFYDKPDAKLDFERGDAEGATITLRHDSDYGKKVISNGIIFEVKPLQKNNFEMYKIQLKEREEDDAAGEEQNALSPLRYFFDEDIEITDDKDKKNKYLVDRKGSNPDEYQIVLRNKSTSLYTFPPEGAILSVRANTINLKRQLEAVSILKLMPLKDHEMLIRLFENKDKTRWARFEEKKVNEWFVLKDESRSGCSNQREFIRKALATPDFAVLEGPPGSGKTTVILELICQLVSQGKRVLLCGSTNVAIDNVLERLIEEKNGPALINSIDLLPVRIGRADRVDERIVKYQLDNLLEEDMPENEKKWRQQLLLEAANLVCGTTMGIVNHPKFKARSGGVRGMTFHGDTPIIPEFECLIIDECSKTTFQEFLVPALYAKRWILAGDVMQLSPFTERDNIEHNFEKLSWPKENAKGQYEELDINIQKAVFYLEKMRDCLHEKNGELNKNRFVLVVDAAALEKIISELAFGRIGKFHEETVFAFVTRQEEKKSRMDNVLIRSPKDANFLELVACNLIFVSKEIYHSENFIAKIPPTHAILLNEKWKDTQFAFCHNAAQKKIGYEYHHRGEKLTNSFEIAKEINEAISKRSWAQEIAWRVDSEHQLRLVDGSKRRENLGQQIEELTPCSVDPKLFKEARDIIVAMSFPSILESLVTGIKGKKPRDPSTITEGFSDSDLSIRKTTLVFQHRMHPQISSSPRERFYTAKNALQDLEHPNIEAARQWDYPHYNRRSIWLDVKTPEKFTPYKNRNIYEAQAMMRELQHFIDYAQNNQQPEGKEWEVACLAFYQGQEKLIREGGDLYGKRVKGLQEITGEIRNSTFAIKGGGKNTINIRLHTVDKFQGHEADVVFLSMTQTKRDGFLDNPNRLNVSITRAKFQLVIFGDYDYFSQKSKSQDLQKLALAHENSKVANEKEEK
ncbi:MAG: AAA domain-containing protein [Spirochaetes bacterium]|nr:AAA domain-containing protein [Spirochaetota bacterium]